MLIFVVEKVVDIVCYISEDFCIGLVDVDFIVIEFFDLDLYYFEELDIEKVIKIVIEVEVVVMNYDLCIINLDGVLYNVNLGMCVYGNMYGINVGYFSSCYLLSCMVIGV